MFSIEPSGRLFTLVLPRKSLGLYSYFQNIIFHCQNVNQVQLSRLYVSVSKIPNEISIALEKYRQNINSRIFQSTSNQIHLENGQILDMQQSQLILHKLPKRYVSNQILNLKTGATQFSPLLFIVSIHTWRSKLDMKLNRTG